MTSSAPPSYREPSVIDDIGEPAPTYTRSDILVTDTLKVVLDTGNAETNHTNDNNTLNQQAREQAQIQREQQLRKAQRSSCCSCIRSLILVLFFTTFAFSPLIIIWSTPPARRRCWDWEEDCYHEGERSVMMNATVSASVLMPTSLSGIMPTETQSTSGAISSMDSLFSKEMELRTKGFVSKPVATETTLERRYSGLQRTFATMTRDVIMVQMTGN